ncbi:hypothetical protein LIER_24930 [Lithospermum erythrorhizon]|uniref:Uncharacterized protein n=1 Tax=Lithospermum erythrorhizon TaxID=34254 RepID=A0AAV3R6X5_LITER
MDFVFGLPRTLRKNDGIWVMVDRLSKSSHFLPIKSTHGPEHLARLYIDQIMRLHGVPIERKKCYKIEEATWEREEDVRNRYPHLFEI